MGNSLAASVCNAKRLLADCTDSLLLASARRTSPVSGSAFRMSSSLRAATVVDSLSWPTPKSA
ncbi:hypothetical protein D3C77_656920 [compost metagenome]